MIFILISILLIALYAVLMIYYRRAWISIPSFAPKVHDIDKLPFVSVIISARNEEMNIADCLHSLTRQSYNPGRFEVIVINDHSEDSTADIVKGFTGKFKNIILVNLSDHLEGAMINSYKKKAIETGIAASSGELIMTTDADCIVSADWLFTVASYYNQHQSAMIASPVTITMPVRATWTQRLFYSFQILDFMTLQGITGAALFKQFHYMANGANLAYPKAIFTEVGGFQGIDMLASGDDMLLMDKVRMIKPTKIHYLKSMMSTVSTDPEKTLGLFFNQRVRWASKSASYRDYRIKSVLALVYMVNVWCLILLGMSIFTHSYWHLLIFLLFKIAIELLFLFPVSNFFHQRKRLWWFVPLQPFHIIYIILAGWFGSLGSYRWKGRKVK